MFQKSAQQIMAPIITKMIVSNIYLSFVISNKTLTIPK